MNDTLHFSRIKAEDMPLIFRYFEKEKERTCDYSYGGIMMWVDYFNYEYAIADDTLFIKGISPTGDGEVFYLPIGKMHLNSSLERLSSYCRENKLPVSLMVQMTDLTRVMSVYKQAKVFDIPDWRDYLYDINDLATFRGNRMKKKRNHYNGFLSAYPDHTVEVITDSNLDELHAFAEKHASTHADSMMEQYENRETIKVLERYYSYPFEGILIRVDGKIAGFTIGEVRGDTLFAHIEKGNTEYRGIYQALCLNFCKMIAEKHPEVAYVNREDDAGDENLRKSKLSYSPIGYVDKYIVKV